MRTDYCDSGCLPRRPQRRSAMPPIRRALSLTIFILLLFIFLHLPSRAALQSLFSSQENALYSSSYTGITHKTKYRVEPSTSTSTQVETSIPGSEVVTGFTLLDRVYLRGGTFFIVTANQSAFPPKRNMIAPGLDMGAGHNMEPTDKVLSYKDHSLWRVKITNCLCQGTTHYRSRGSRKSPWAERD
jgi:hypothetical protein